MTISLAESPTDIEKCFPVIVQMRKNLTEEEFIKQVERQRKYGFKLAFIEDNSIVVAVAGFKILENLAKGKYLFVDDLVTDTDNRSKGYGSALFDWLVDYAKKENCKQLRLDSQVEIFAAHRFYLRKRMNIIAHHFRLDIEA